MTPTGIVWKSLLIGGLPDWIEAGLVLGAVLAGLVALTFVVGLRRFDEPDNPAHRQTVSGGTRHRTAVRGYLRAIGESFEEDATVGDRSVPFYLTQRDIAITYDARDYFLLERSGSQAVLLEYELPPDRLGDRLPFETPTIEPPTAQAAGAYARLGLTPGASEAAIRAAYRERVKDAHPDHGGSRAAFSELREAYTLARDRTD